MSSSREENVKTLSSEGQKEVKELKVPENNNNNEATPVPVKKASEYGPEGLNPFGMFSDLQARFAQFEWVDTSWDPLRYYRLL